MALYGIADLHLSLGTDKPMDDFPGWSGYVDRLRSNWIRLINDDDVVVIAGDISWGMTLQEALLDFRFLNELPGKKLLLKGNHDYWWETRRKMDAFFADHHLDSLIIVHNDSFEIDGGYAVCGTRGWFYDAEADADKKVLNREIGRLKMSVEHATKRGLRPIVFLHYPPIFAGTVCEEMMNALCDIGVSDVYYGHIHGKTAIGKCFVGSYRNVRMHLISGDSLQFVPQFIL